MTPTYLEPSHAFSLLWPGEESPAQAIALSSQTIRDLDLETVVAAMCPAEQYRKPVKDALYRLPTDPQVIRYRQAVVADLLANPTLAQAFTDLLPALDELANFAHRKWHDQSTLHAVTGRVGELQLLVECLRGLEQAFQVGDQPLQSSGLQALRQTITNFVASPEFRNLTEQLPRLLAELRASASLTIGVNLDQFLRPEEAVLLSVNAERFTESNFLDRLLGRGPEHGKGIAPLHRPPMVSQHDGMITGLPTGGPPKRVEPLMVPLFRDLSDILEKISQPIAQALQRYIHFNGRFLVKLRAEIVFYVMAVALAHRLQAEGLPVCLPEVATLEERCTEVEATYNLHLALHLACQAQAGEQKRRIVTNDLMLGRCGHIVILTGPNQGGKTTYLQAAGLVQVLGQVGICIPGRRGRLSPVDGIFTHYPSEERLELGTGRFGDEASRLRSIFEQLIRHSLVLLKESLSTTNTGESVYLAQDLVRAMRQVGLRAVFTTHLHELAEAIPELNAGTPGDSLIVRMVASAVLGELPSGELPADGYSYRVEFGLPLGRSFAARIATQYGIAKEQLLAMLTARGVLATDSNSGQDETASDSNGANREPSLSS